MARVAPVFATGAAVPVLVGLASGDRPTAIQLAGIPVAIAGVMLVSVQREKASGARIEPSGRLTMVVAIATSTCLGLIMVAVDHVADYDAVWGVFLARATAAAIFVVAAGVILGPRLRTDARMPPAAIPIGLLDTGANVLFGTASTLGLLSLVAVIAGAFPAVTVALSLMLLRERLNVTQTVGVVGTLAGSLMIVSGSA